MPGLLAIGGCSDMYSDACLRHPDNGELLFMSVYGRSSDILNLISRFTLPKEQGGLPEFSLVDADGRPSTVFVSDPGRLKKQTAKLPRDSLFGEFAHIFIYDPRVQSIDQANRIAWGIWPFANDAAEPLEEADLDSRLWQVVKELSPLPLDEAWRSDVMRMCFDRSHVRWLHQTETLHPPLGGIRACHVHLSDQFIDDVSQGVRRGLLAIPAAALAKAQVEESTELPSSAEASDASQAGIVA